VFDRKSLVLSLLQCELAATEINGLPQVENARTELRTAEARFAALSPEGASRPTAVAASAAASCRPPRGRLPPQPDQFKRRANGQRPRAASCRWFHLPGCSHKAIDLFRDQYHLVDEVVDACKDTHAKPSCSWHQGEEKVDACFDHLFLSGQVTPAPARRDVQR
jgi:hypothetical protein